jgi:hypothetical protein
MGMSIEETKLSAEVGSIRELNLYLAAGWKLLLSYVDHTGDSQAPKFVIGWQTDSEPLIPELLDEWELNELTRQQYR